VLDEVPSVGVADEVLAADRRRRHVSDDSAHRHDELALVRRGARHHRLERAQKRIKRSAHDAKEIGQFVLENC